MKKGVWIAGILIIAFFSIIQGSIAAEIIIDNKNSGFSKVGAWSVSGSSGYYGSDSIYSKTVGNTATWAATLPSSGTYKVYAWWTYSSSRAKNAPYLIYDGTKLIKTARVNQRNQSLAGKWNLLGTLTFSSTSAKIVLKVESSSYSYNADAVRFVSTSASSPAVYYVAKNGNNANPGTEAQPWLTIQKAADTMIAGDSVYIKAGTYKERVIPKNSGTSGKPITYQAYPGNEVIIESPNTRTDYDYAIYISNKNYLTFKGLKATGANKLSNEDNDPQDKRSAGFYVNGPADNIILDGIASENNNYGIYFLAYDGAIRNSIIKNSVVTNSKHHGIFLYGMNYDILIDKNHASYSGWNSNAWGHNIKVLVWTGDNPSGPERITITNNELDHAQVQGIMTWNARNILIRNNYCHHNGATGIQIEDGSKNIIVENNICEYNSLKWDYETGIWIDNSENVIVQNNTLRGNNIGLTITTTLRAIARNNIVYENSIGVNEEGLPDFSNTIGINVENNNHHAVVVHNTLYKNSHPDGSRAGMNIGTYNPTYETIIKNNIISETKASLDLWVGNAQYTSDYNNYYNSRDLSVYWQGSVKTWAEYLTASSQDSHSITANPLFTDPVNGNFNLQANSPAINKGDFLTKTTSSGSSTSLKVQDARYFTNGYGLIEGDLIKIGANNPVKVISVDYATNTLTLDKSISWNAGDGVSYLYSGAKPDIGAYESKETALSCQDSGGVCKPNPCSNYQDCASSGESCDSGYCCKGTCTSTSPQGAVLILNLDEGSGNQAFDSSGNNNHGTINGAQWATGIMGKALLFDGNDYLSGILPELQNQPKTIAMWIYRKSGTSSGIFSIGDNPIDNSPQTLLRGGTSNVRIYCSGCPNSYLTTPSGSFFNDNWYHVAFSYDGVNFKIYLNGILVSNFNGKEFSAGNNYYIGSGYSSGFNGLIDDVRIYDRALTADEIKKLADRSLKSFLRGDLSNQNQVDPGDAQYILDYLLNDGNPPACLKTADVNDDGIIDIADAIYLLQFLYNNGPAPKPPYPGIGIDETIDTLAC